MRRRDLRAGLPQAPARRHACRAARCPRPSRSLVAAGVAAAATALAGEPAGGELELALRPDPSRPRRALRQQRLAAGVAQADHQADLGQRLLLSPAHRRAARRRGQRDRRAHRAGRAQAHRSGLAAARPGRRRRHRPPGLRPHARRPGGERHRLQRLRGADPQQPLRPARRHPRGDRRERPARHHAGAPLDRLDAGGERAGDRARRRAPGDARRVREGPALRARRRARGHRRQRLLQPGLRVQGLRLGHGRST